MSHPVDFIFPGGRPCALHRAVVFNSWLLWRDALPEDPCTWDRLQRRQVHAIGKLAQQLRVLRREARPGWRVLQWWDPRHEAWASGRRLLLDVGPPWRDSPHGINYHLGCHTITEIQRRLLRNTDLACALRSDRVLEILLPQTRVRRLG